MDVTEIRLVALDRVIANYQHCDVSTTGAHAREVIAEAKKIEDYLIHGTVPESNSA